MRKTVSIGVQPRELVKVTPTGRFSITIILFIKPIIRDFIEDHINDTVVGNDLTVYSGTLMCKALIEEIYKKHYTALHTNGESRITLTRAQAIALWEMLFANDDMFDSVDRNPSMGNLFMQLTQKLV